jgi:hypothetical protein
MDLDRNEWEGGCHCGAVRFRARLTNGLRTAIRCNCSMCRMRGAVVVFAAVDKGVTILSGEDRLGHYQFNTGTAHHYFCSVCGIYTHHQRRLDPNQFAINVACLDGLSPFDFAQVPVMDGVHHPLDDPGRRNRWAGVVKFEPADD